jgi:polysaccharide biosynthesis transport protein
MVVAVFTATLTTLLAFIMALPNVYVSTAVIAVEGQQVPTDIVPSQSTLGVEGRLRVLSQRILSRARLRQLADEFDLYGDLKAGGERQVGQSVTSAVRRDITIQVHSDGSSREDTTIALELSYAGAEQDKVQRVVDKLAFFFVSENQKDREQQAAGTADFLRVQLKETQQKLEEHERKIAAYKQRHIEELPEHLAANLAALSQMRSQIDNLSASVASAQERREVLSRRLEVASGRAPDNSVTKGDGVASANREMPRGGGSTGGPANPGALGVSLVSQLAAQRGRLDQMLVRFSDKHPDVMQLRSEIAALEQKIAENPDAATMPGSGDGTQPGLSAPMMTPEQVLSAAAESARKSAELTALQTELATLESEIQRKTVELASLRREVTAYQTRVEVTPKHDQELQALTRDYASTHELYLSLLKRLDRSVLAGNLDQSQHGERFTIVEPAAYPQDPVGPRRNLLSLGALVLSLGMAVLSVLLRELVKPVFHTIEELRAFTTVEILGSVPQIVTESEWSKKRARQIVVGVTLLALISSLGMVSHSVAKGQVRIAKVLTKSGGTAQPR